MSTKKHAPNHTLSFSKHIFGSLRISKSDGLHLLVIILTLTLTILSTLTQNYSAYASGSENISSSQQKLVLLDFESDEQLDELGWKCGTTYERTKEYAVSGQYSLKMEMYPRVTWPGFSKSIKTSWAGYNNLSLNIFNPESSPIHIFYRIDDRCGNPPYADRANGRFLLNPGANTLSLNLKELKTSDGKRHLDLTTICSFLLFLHQPHEKTTLYLDDLTLTKPGPIERITNQNHTPGTKWN